jgi:tyrosyl-tRNA synthetase
MNERPDIKDIFDNAVDALPRYELVRRLAGEDTLRVKLGIDPTAPDIHLGFVVVLKKLRQFQDLGHTAVLVIGDYTARVGDPSGRSKTRPILSAGQIEDNTRTYLEQAYTVLDRERTEVRRNSEWLAPMTMIDIITLTRATTVARILERDDFQKRFAAQDQISLTELLYPLMQAYDSVAIDADIELGGTDQLYNLLIGRQVMEYYGKTPQCVLTTPLLVGTDGKMKMSKSLGNYIGVTDSPNDMFGKAMSIPDGPMREYYRLLLDRPMPEAEPVAQKRELARSLVREFHDEKDAKTAEKHFNTVTRRGIPEEVRTVHLGATAHGQASIEMTVLRWIVNVIVQAGLARTNSEARRFIRSGAVRLNGQVITDETLQVPEHELDGKVLQVGKRRYARLEVKP